VTVNPNSSLAASSAWHSNAEKWWAVSSQTA